MACSPQWRCGSAFGLPTEDAIRQLLALFHGRVRRNPQLGSVFVRAVGTTEADWAPHLARLPDFWSSVMLRSGRYRGDRFWPMCSSELLARPGHVTELLRYPLIHMHWQASEPAAPTWARWLAAAQAQDPMLGGLVAPGGLLFREELHAIEAMIAGQGIAICSDVLVARELRSGALVKAHDLALPSFGFWLAYRPGHGRRAAIETFIRWVRGAVDS